MFLQAALGLLLGIVLVITARAQGAPPAPSPPACPESTPVLCPDATCCPMGHACPDCGAGMGICCEGMETRSVGAASVAIGIALPAVVCGAMSAPQSFGFRPARFPRALSRTLRRASTLQVRVSLQEMPPSRGWPGQPHELATRACAGLGASVAGWNSYWLAQFQHPAPPSWLHCRHPGLCAGAGASLPAPRTALRRPLSAPAPASTRQRAPPPRAEAAPRGWRGRRGSGTRAAAAGGGRKLERLDSAHRTALCVVDGCGPH